MIFNSVRKSSQSQSKTFERTMECQSMECFKFISPLDFFFKFEEIIFSSKKRTGRKNFCIKRYIFSVIWSIKNAKNISPRWHPVPPQVSKFVLSSRHVIFQAAQNHSFSVLIIIICLHVSTQSRNDLCKSTVPVPERSLNKCLQVWSWKQEPQFQKMF